MTRQLCEALAPEEAAALAQHLDTCPACRRELADSRAFAARLLAARPAAVPAGARPDLRGLALARTSRRLWTGEGFRILAGAAAVAAVAGLVIWALPKEHARPVRVGAGPPPAPLHTAGGPLPTGGARNRPDAAPRTAGASLPRTSQPAPPSAGIPPRDGTGAVHVEIRSPEQVAAADERYLDGWDPGLMKEWVTGHREDRELSGLLGKPLPQMRDDFVQPPSPLIADADPKSGGLREAVKQYEKEAAVVDARLFRTVTLQLKATPLSELCEAIEKQTQVRLSASRSVGDENVTVLVRDRPAREVMREVARLFGYRWSRSGEEGAYRYELFQDLKGQLAEEEMRNRDRHAALLALDERMAEYRPYLELTHEQVQARLKGAQGKEKELLQVMAGRGWGLVQVYYRLSPAQRLALANGEALTFSTHSEAPDLQLPRELRRRILDSTNLTLGTFEGAPAIVDQGFGQPGTPLADVPDASASVTLFMGRSELGEITLGGNALGQLESDPNMTRMFWAGGANLAAATSPSVAKPENASANAALRALPQFRQKISVSPKPSCPWFAPNGKPKDTAGFEIVMGGQTLFFGPGEHMEKDAAPHVTSAEVWEAVHAATGLSIIADSYSRAYDARPMKIDEAPAFDALCRLGDGMGLRWRKDGEFLLARSTSFFWDKLKEVPVRYLRRWREERRNEGSLPLEAVLEMSTLSDAQLDSRTVGYVIGHCWGLEEWGMVGSGGSFRLGLPGGGYMRPYARFLARLNPGQLGRARSQTGLGLSDLQPGQQEALVGLLLKDNSDPARLEGFRLRLEYAPVGTFIWHPVVNTTKEAEAMNARWPAVVGRTAEETLAAARRYNPTAEAGEIHASRGALALMFRNARGDTWSRGGPGVAFRMTQ